MSVALIPLPRSNWPRLPKKSVWMPLAPSRLFYYKNTEDWVAGYYKDLIESVKTPVFAYNNPETSRFTFTLKTIQKLQGYGLKGMKDSPLEVGFVSRTYYDAKLNNKDFQIILGISTGWLPYYYMGIKASIAGINNWAPEVMTELMKATFTGDVARSEKAYWVMMDLGAKMHFTDSTVASTWRCMCVDLIRALC